MTGQIKSPRTLPDIATLEIYEPLDESAMLAMQWSKNLCVNCGTYHGAWQVLRLLGVLNSMRSDDDFLIVQLDAVIGNGARRILISGAADYALMARIAAVAKRHDTTVQVTVVDLCKTPLELNQWYASRVGMSVELRHENILEYRNPDRFDLVCTHSFLPFFSPVERSDLVKVWWHCLAPGGAVLTAQRTRPNDASARHGFSSSQAEVLGERAYQLAAEQYDRLGIDPDLARSLATDYAASRSTYLIRDSEQLRQLFLQQGFELEQFAQPGIGQYEKDIPSTPTASDDFRWRILARKPAI